MKLNGLRRKRNSGRRNNFKRPRKRLYQVVGDIVLEYCNLMIPLSAGYSDTVMIYRNGNSLLILTTNNRLGYIGLDEVDLLDGDIIGTVFLHEYQIKDCIGSHWQQMKAETLIRRLQPYQ